MTQALIADLQWRGLIAQTTDLDSLLKDLNTGQTAFYIGFDPTAPSLHMGNLVVLLVMRRFQLAGHKPLPLVGGATGLVGDPSGRNEERTLNDTEVVEQWVQRIRKQLSQFLVFDGVPNSAVMTNNLDWTAPISALSFLRDIGKHFSVNQMLSKDSVSSRLEAGGISYTEFSYQVLQAYDFLELYRRHNCTLQIGGSDQWGNITTGAELIRRKTGGEAFAFTCPLITKADGGKFGKTEKGNVWLDAKKTSPYQFYQFWLNASDEDATKWIKIFTLLAPSDIDALIAEHATAPQLRILQKALAAELTKFVHSEEDLNFAIRATEILFGNATTEVLQSLNEEQLLQVMEGVPTVNVTLAQLAEGYDLVSLLADTQIFPSKGEARKMWQAGGLSINKEKINTDFTTATTAQLLQGKYMLLQKGKKNYYLVVAS